MSSVDPDLARLPGWEIVSSGLADLAQGTVTIDAAAVAMARTRLRDAGIAVPELDLGMLASHKLHELLVAEDGAGAHSRYNAIVRRILSFTRAAEDAQPR